MIDKSAFVHPAALVDSNVTIGANTRVWAFAHIVSGAIVGADCNICDHVFIEGKVKIGNRVTIKSGVYLWDGVEIEDDVFIGPNATFTNDKYPRSKQYPAEYAMTLLKQGCSIGANATLISPLIIGKNAMVGAGSVVTRNVADNTLVYGNPAAVKKQF